jgi:hypothetical protein
VKFAIVVSNSATPHRLTSKSSINNFELLVKQFFAFVVGNIVHILATIPTGAASPPLFANALSRTLLAISVRAGGVQDRVEFDCCIDNLRFCSDDLNALWIAWHELIAICAKLGATIGDQQPPPQRRQGRAAIVGRSQQSSPVFDVLDALADDILHFIREVFVVRRVALPPRASAYRPYKGLRPLLVLGVRLLRITSGSLAGGLPSARN